MTQLIFGNWVGITAVIAASLSLILLWIVIARGHKQIPRIFAAFQVSMILLSVGYTHYPNFIMGKGDKNLSLLTTHAPEKTIDTLGTALLVGSLFILPALTYLFYSFRGRQQEHH